MRSTLLTLTTLCILLQAILWPVSGLAIEVPHDALVRLAEIAVEKQELQHLSRIKKITDQEYTTRNNTLDAERKTLWDQHRVKPQITSEEYGRAMTAINGMINTRLSLLEPQWQREEVAFRKDAEKQQVQTAHEVEQNARQAVEFQGQRLLLQQQLDKGTIDRDTFTAKDRDALAGIEALRNKHDPAHWGQAFDERLTQLTKALENNPNTVIAKPHVPPVGEAKLDFDKDVKHAAELLVKYQEMRYKFERKEVSSDTSRESSNLYNHDINRLRTRYHALSAQQGQQFDNAYQQLAAPGIQALNAKYNPEHYRTPTPAATAQQPREPETEHGNFVYWIGGGALFVVFLFFALNRKKAPAKPKTSDIYGSANWADFQADPSSPTVLRRGVFFGHSSLPDIPAELCGAPIASLPEAHTLIVARTGAGKGTRVIVPTLLRYDHSMLIIDPKGENAAITARTRKGQLNQEVHIVNPWGEMKDRYTKLGFETATFNPLDAIDRIDPNAVAVAQNLAATICPISHDKDKFWQGSAANVLSAVFLWLADQEGMPREDDPSKTETKTLARAREIVTQSRSDFKQDLVKMMASTAYQGAIKELVSQYIDLAPETYSGILANLAESTKFLSDPQIKTSTETSSFSMASLRDELMTVYLVIPHDRIQTHSTWLRLVIASAMQSLKNRSRIQTPPRHRCMFLIDEFGSIGHIADIPRDIALMRGYGLDFTLVIQNLGQLKQHYGEDKNTILGNCGYKWFCYIGDLDTAKYLSETLGKKTVRTKSESKSQGVSGKRETEGESTTYAETGRLLLTPDEVLNLGREFAILLNTITNPYYLHTVDYWKLKDVFAPLELQFPYLYWDPDLSYDDNPFVKARPTQSPNEGKMF